MLNFIIYESDEKYRDKYFSVIDKFIGESRLAYEVIEIKTSSKEEFSKLNKVSGNKIYLLDVEMKEKSGLDFAKEIRENGDWESQIIVISSNLDTRSYHYQSELLILGMINKLYDLERFLLESIKRAHSILTSHEFLQFQKNGGVYRVPLHEILYVEKKPEEVYSEVVTKTKSYITHQTLLGLEKYLKNDPRFIRVHRNYIVNTYNIRKIDFDNLTIYFDNNQKVLLSKNYKKNLKDNIKNIKINKEKKKNVEFYYIWKVWKTKR